MNILFYLALMRPDLLPVLKTCTGTSRVAAYSSSFVPKCSCSEASSTRMISSNSSLGDLNIMECIVLNNVVQASLWNTITTLVVGSKAGYCLLLHLNKRRKNTYLTRKKSLLILSKKGIGMIRLFDGKIETQLY